MKKLIIGIAAVGGVLALRSAARRSGHTMSEHCKQMASKCKQMMAEQAGGQGERADMRERCKEMMAVHGSHREEAETREGSEKEKLQAV